MFWKVLDEFFSILGTDLVLLQQKMNKIIINPDTGALASLHEGEGRLPKINDIIHVIKETLKIKQPLKNKNIINFYNKKNNMGLLSMLLCSLTKYVGTIYPGENSIINQININYNELFNFNVNYTYIYSKIQIQI